MFEVIHDHDCPYLPGVMAKTDYRLIEGCPAQAYQQLLRRGWRRFGCTFFRPVCATCSECRSLRLNVDTFKPSRSMLRTWRKNQDLRVLLQPVSLTEAHLDLYTRYHYDMAQRRDWSDKSITPDSYVQTFVEGRNDYGFELLYMKDDELLGVALVDLLPQSMSAVYCYYDPEKRSRGIGVFSVLMHLELARQRGIPYVYLGYWIESNASMRYKSRYRPHEILEGRPKLEEEAVWRVAPDPDKTVDAGAVQPLAKTCSPESPDHGP